MTGELTDRLNETTLFGMALFWQKAIELFTKFIIHFLTYRVECLFSPEFYCLLYLFYRSLSDWVEYELLGHRSMCVGYTDRWPRIADVSVIDF